MSKASKIWLTVAASLVILGTIMFSVALAACGWDFSKLGAGNFKTNTYTFTEDVHTVSMQISTADVTFAASEDESIRVECYEKDNEMHTVTVKDGTLSVRVNPKKWYQYIGINWHSPRITVYLPSSYHTFLNIKANTGDITLPAELTFESVHIETDTGDVKTFSPTKAGVKIKTSTGNIHVENISPQSLDLAVSTGRVTVSAVTCAYDMSVKVSTGDAKLTNLTCQNLTSTGSTGNINLTRVIASGQMTIKRSTGNVKFDGCDAAELTITTDTGNVTGTLLSEKVFIHDTDTGSVSLPGTTSGGTCKITTDTGNIKIAIES